MLSCKILSSIKSQINMRRIVHNQSSQRNSINNSGKTRNSTTIHSISIHYRSFHFNRAFIGKNRTSTSIEVWNILQFTNLWTMIIIRITFKTEESYETWIHTRRRHRIRQEQWHAYTDNINMRKSHNSMLYCEWIHTTSSTTSRGAMLDLRALTPIWRQWRRASSRGWRRSGGSEYGMSPAPPCRAIAQPISCFFLISDSHNSLTRLLNFQWCM